MVRIVVPEEVQDVVIRVVHESRVRGHWGVSRTAAVVGSKFWWNNWLQSVQKYVAECELCLSAQKTAPAATGPMRVHSPARRSELVAMDVLTVSPTSEGSTKIPVLGDLLSRFVVAAGIPNENANTIARTIMDRYVSIFGPPETLLSDGGLASEVVRELCRILGTKLVTTLPYHPHGNGFVERYNRTLLQDLRKLLHSKELSEWHALLSLSVLRYNTTIHSRTRMTPFRSMFGTEILPLEWAVQRADLELREHDEKQTTETMAAIEALLCARTKRDRQRVKIWYDERLKHMEKFNPGDAVYVFHPPDTTAQGRKLTNAWRPMTVLQQTNVNAYLLVDDKNTRVRAHVDRIRKAPAHTHSVETWDRLSPANANTRRKIFGRRVETAGVEWKLRTRGRNGYVWKKQSDLPPALVENLERTFVAA